MSVQIINKPSAGSQLSVAVEPGGALEFAFDPSSASFKRTGADLELSFENGGQVLLDGFFAPGEGTALPSLRLPDGSVVAGASFLAALDPDMDLSTAAGTPAVSSSSGLNAYTEDAGELIDGLDRLGLKEPPSAATTARAAASVEMPDTLAPWQDTPDGATPGGGRPEPGGPEKTEALYSARAVLYATTEDAGEARLQFRVLGADGKPAPDPSSYTVASANGLVDIDSLSFDAASGLFSIQLSAAGKAALAKALDDANGDRSGAANVYDYLSITDAVSGRSYTMQVMLNQNGEYDAGRENLLHAPGGGIIAEWHSETNGTGQGDRFTGGSADGLFFSNTGAGLRNGVADTGLGADVVRITGGKYGVLATTAAEVKAVEGQVFIQADGENQTMDAYAYGDGASVGIAGRNVTLGAESEQGTAYGMLATQGAATVVTTGPQGTITVNATSAAGARAMDARNNGENTLTGTGSAELHATVFAEEGNAWAMGMYAANEGRNTVNDTGSLTISAEHTTKGTYGASAMFAVDASSANKIAVTGTADLHAKSTNGTVYTVYSGDANNTITADRVEIRATSQADADAGSRYNSWLPYVPTIAVQTNGGVNTITAGTVTINTYGTEHSSQKGLAAWDNGKNIIEAKEIGIAIEEVATYSNSEAMIAGGGGQNILVGREGANITVGGKTYDGAGIRITGTVFANPDGKNIILGTDKDDFVKISGLVHGVVDGTNTIDLSGGKDYVSVSGVGGGTELLFGAGLKTVELGAMSGDNARIVGEEGSRFNLTIGKQGATQAVLSGSTDKLVRVDTGGTGLDDTITIHGGINSHSSTVLLQTGGGTDSISIYGNIGTTNNKTVISTGGEGNDHATITVTGTLDSGFINSGNNIFTTSKVVVASDNTVDLKLGLGTGDDTLIMHADCSTGTNSHNQVHMGTGNDYLEINGDFAAQGSGTNTVMTYADKDTVVINGNLTATSSGAKNIIDTGAEDDQVIINGDITGVSAANNQVLLGDGNDTLVFSGETIINSLLNGGTGSDTLQLNILEENLAGIFTPGKNSISNFETLILNLDNGSNENLSLADLFDKTGETFDTLLVQLNNGDTLNAVGWTANGTREMDGMVYDVYQNGDDTVYVKYMVESVTG